MFAQWLRGSRLGARDVVGVLSVGGGDAERGISVTLIRALEYAKSVRARVFGIVGRNGGFTATIADVCVIVPTVSPATLTAHAEAFQAVVWHLLVAHPRLQAAPMKWESVTMPPGRPTRWRFSSIRQTSRRSKRRSNAASPPESPPTHPSSRRKRRVTFGITSRRSSVSSRSTDTTSR